MVPQVWAFSPPGDSLNEPTNSESCPTTPEHMPSTIEATSPPAELTAAPTSAPMSVATSVDDGDQVMQDVFTDYTR